MMHPAMRLASTDGALLCILSFETTLGEGNIMRGKGNNVMSMEACAAHLQ